MTKVMTGASGKRVYVDIMFYNSIFVSKALFYAGKMPF